MSEKPTKRIIIINGSGGVGKDAFCRAVSRYAGVTVRSSIDPIKTVARQLGWSGGKSEKDRKFLSDLKALTTGYNDWAMQYLRGAVGVFHDPDDADEILFLHIREPEEIERAAKEFDAVTVLVKNSRIPKVTSNKSDASVDGYWYDAVIHNEGTVADLDRMAEQFVSWLHACCPFKPAVFSPDSAPAEAPPPPCP